MLFKMIFRYKKQPFYAFDAPNNLTLYFFKVKNVLDITAVLEKTTKIVVL